MVLEAGCSSGNDWAAKSAGEMKAPLEGSLLPIHF
jgi:hypothetical protein